jgi:hypothetical protein
MRISTDLNSPTSSKGVNVNKFPGTKSIETVLVHISTISPDDYIGADDLDLLVVRGDDSEYLNEAMRWVFPIFYGKNRPAVPVTLGRGGIFHLLGGYETVSAYDYAGELFVPVTIIFPDNRYKN